MAVLRINGFLGENRALHPSLLDARVGTTSVNQKPGRGDLRPWAQPQTVATVPAGRQTIYRMGRDVNNDTQYWLSWPSVVHVVRGFDPTDTTERTYFTGAAGGPKVTDNTTLDGVNPQDNPTVTRPLGVPAPSTVCSVNVVGGTGTPSMVFYTYTYVTDWGWESAPAPPTTGYTVYQDSTVTISGFASPPSGNYNINRIRIYRTQTGSSSSEFFFLREILVTDTSTTDDHRQLGEVLPTTTWAVPPSDLSFLTALWNGMLAGISGNAVRFCEAYVPYAWPEEYDVVPPDSKPVALGVFGQSLLVLTTGRPLLVAGSSPESMDQRLLEIPQACIAPLSAVSMGSGVAWASEDGLCWYGANGARILTSGLMTRSDWQALNPSSIIGKFYEGLYFGSYDNGSGRKGFFINPMDPQGIYFLDTGYSALYFDELLDQLYVLDGTNVKKWDAGSAMTTTFRSKLFSMPHQFSFACAEVVADAYPVTLKVDAVNLTTTEVSRLTSQYSTLLTSPTSTSVRYSVTVNSRNPVRLPPVCAKDWYVEVSTTGAVQSVAVATSMEELKQV